MFVLSLDLYTSTITFRYKTITLTWGISDKITSIELLYVDSTGYMELKTNIDVESVDLFILAEDLLTSKEMKTLKQKFAAVHLSDFCIKKVGGSYMADIADKIKDQAYMILSDLAFVLERGNEPVIHVYNLRNISRRLTLKVINKSFRLMESNMSELLTYKSLYLAERNKSFLLEGLFGG